MFRKSTFRMLLGRPTPRLLAKRSFTRLREVLFLFLEYFVPLVAEIPQLTNASKFAAQHADRRAQAARLRDGAGGARGRPER